MREYRRIMRRRGKAGLTLIELMIAVSVLSVGIVVILQARLGVLSALDTAANKMKAWQFFENKMNVLEQAVTESGGIENQAQQEDVMIGSRRAKWTMAMSSVEMTENEEEEDQACLLEVSMNLS